MAVSLRSIPNVATESDETVSFTWIGRLKILLVIESAGGGSGRHVIDLARGLAGLGHEVTVVFSPLRAESEFVASLDALQGVALHPITMHLSFGWRDVTAIVELRKYIREHGPFDIAHAHSSKAGAILRLAIPGIDAACIYTPHALVTLDDQLSFPKRFFFTAAERILSLAADRIICVSEEEAAHAARIGLPPRKLRVVHNGLVPLPDADRAQIRVQLGISEDAVCLGTVGRLSPAKALDRLISAFALVYQTFPQLRLVIVGDGPERTGLESLARRIGVYDRTLFVGQADGPAVMAAMDIFALTSRYEGFPYAVLEAAARGLPIIMTNVGGASTMVEEGVNGFIVPQDHIELLAQRISELCVSGDRRRMMGERSRQIVIPFGVRQMLARTLEIYADVLNLRDAANEN